MSSLRKLAVALLATAATVFMADAALAEKIVISNWDGYMPKDLPEKFKAETGIDVEVAVHATNEEIMGKVVASKGEGFDVLFVSSPFAEALSKLGIIAKLDRSKLSNIANLYPEATELKHDPGNSFSIPYTWGTTGLCYRSDVVKSEPTSWNDLLKPADELKKKTTMLATDRWLMAAGELALGMSVNETDPAKLEEVKALLIETKKTLLAYDDTTFFSKLVSGEASLVHAWDGWCNFGITDKPEIKYVIPKEGTDLFVDTMVVVESSPNKDAAHKFIDYILKAETGKWVVENTLYKSANKAGMETVDKAVLAKYPNLSIPPSELLKNEQLRDLGDGLKNVSKVVSEILAAK
jgi:spermidine/putrescine transport system substrate-binding protein